MSRLGRIFTASLLLLVSFQTASAQIGGQRPRPALRTQQQPTSEYPRSSYSGAASTVATTTSMAVLDDSRKLGVGDTVSFRVVEDRDPPVPLIVTDSGEMEVPYIGRVKAVGRTCKALAMSIKSVLEVDYYYRATVIVALDSISVEILGKITVSGEVAAQGSQEIPPKGQMTASKAIANAGGITRFGDERKVRIIRQSPDGGSSIIIFDYKKFLREGGEDVVLQPNDTINVPQRAIVGF